MNVTRKQERLLRRALAEWQQEGALTPDEHQRLAGSLKRVAMDWQRLSRYAFPARCCCRGRCCLPWRRWSLFTSA